jgi:hypothetical protein
MLDLPLLLEKVKKETVREQSTVRMLDEMKPKTGGIYRDI